MKNKLNKMQMLLAIVIRKVFKYLYYNSSIIGIENNDGIQVGEDGFACQFRNSDYIINADRGKQYPYELTATFAGVNFFTIGTKEEMENEGLL